MIDRTQFIVELRNFSSAERPVTARALFNKHGRPGEKVEDYQRTIARFAREIQTEQFELSFLSKPQKLIFSCNEGYYVAKTRQEAEKGLRYYQEKLYEMLKQRSKLKKVINLTYPEEAQTTMFQ